MPFKLAAARVPFTRTNIDASRSPERVSGIVAGATPGTPLAVAKSMSGNLKRGVEPRAARRPKQARIAPRNLGVRPFLDDLREMERICGGGGGERVTTLARWLIKEALRARRIARLTDAGGDGPPGRDGDRSGDLQRWLDAIGEELNQLRALVSACDPARLAAGLASCESALGEIAARAETRGDHLRALYALAVQIVGYAVTIEGEARLTLERALASGRGEDAREALARLDKSGRRKADALVRSVLHGQGLAR